MAVDTVKPPVDLDPVNAWTHAEFETIDMNAAAHRLRRAGFGTISILPGGGKIPGHMGTMWSWPRYGVDQAPMDHAQIDRYWPTDGNHRPRNPGIGAVLGRGSSGIMLLELERRAVDEGVFGQLLNYAVEVGKIDLLIKVFDTWEVRSGSGGMHFFIRLADVETLGYETHKGRPGIASRPARTDEITERERASMAAQQAAGRQVTWPKRCLIEILGTGRQAVLWPSHGPIHRTGHPYRTISGSPETIVTLDVDEWLQVVELVKAMDQMPKELGEDWKKATGVAQPSQPSRPSPKGAPKNNPVIGVMVGALWAGG